MNNSYTSVIPVSIANGTKTGSESMKIDPGKTVRLVVFSSAGVNDNFNNPNLVRVEVKVNGQPIIPLQPLSMLRSREVASDTDGVKIPDVGNRVVDVAVISASNFTADTSFDFVFVYE